MGGAEVQIRGAKTTTVITGQVDISDRASRLLGIVTSITDPVNVNILDLPLDVNITDDADRLLGIVYGSQHQQLQQRSSTYELLVQLTSAGIQIDPRDRNWNLSFLNDKVDVSGSTIIATIPDTVDISDRASRLLGIIYGSQNQQLLQRAATFDLQTQLRTAGIEYDARDRNWNLDFLTDQVDVSGSTITVTNVPTTPINDFNIGSNIVPGSSSIHTYTATGNFKLTSIEASASGAMKIEIKVGFPGSEITRMVAFSSESNLIIQLRFHEEIQITTGQRIQIVRINRETEAMDVFSTIMGFND